MTTEEMERAMAFLLEHQANLTATVGQLSVTVDRLAGTVETLGQKVDKLAEKVDKLAGKVDRTADSVTALLAIAEMHERELTESREAQARTDERLNALIDTVERYISGNRNGSS